MTYVSGTLHARLSLELLQPSFLLSLELKIPNDVDSFDFAYR